MISGLRPHKNTAIKQVQTDRTQTCSKDPSSPLPMESYKGSLSYLSNSDKETCIKSLKTFELLQNGTKYIKKILRFEKPSLKMINISAILNAINNLNSKRNLSAVPYVDYAWIFGNTGLCLIRPRVSYTLADVMKDDSQNLPFSLDPLQFHHILLKVLDNLLILYENGLVHGNLELSQIGWDTFGEVKMMDIYLPSLLCKTIDQSELTEDWLYNTKNINSFKARITKDLTKFVSDLTTLLKSRNKHFYGALLPVDLSFIAFISNLDKNHLLDVEILKKVRSVLEFMNLERNRFNFDEPNFLKVSFKSSKLKKYKDLLQFKSIHFTSLADVETFLDVYQHSYINTFKIHFFFSKTAFIKHKALNILCSVCLITWNFDNVKKLPIPKDQNSFLNIIKIAIDLLTFWHCEKNRFLKDENGGIINFQGAVVKMEGLKSTSDSEFTQDLKNLLGIICKMCGIKLGLSVTDTNTFFNKRSDLKRLHPLILVLMSERPNTAKIYDLRKLVEGPQSYFSFVRLFVSGNKSIQTGSQFFNFELQEAMKPTGKTAISNHSDKKSRVHNNENQELLPTLLKNSLTTAPFIRTDEKLERDCFKELQDCYFIRKCVLRGDFMRLSGANYKILSLYSESDIVFKPMTIENLNTHVKIYKSRTPTEIPLSSLPGQPNCPMTYDNDKKFELFAKLLWAGYVLEKQNIAHENIHSHNVYVDQDFNLVIYFINFIELLDETAFKNQELMDELQTTRIFYEMPKFSKPINSGESSKDLMYAMAKLSLTFWYDTANLKAIPFDKMMTENPHLFHIITMMTAPINQRITFQFLVEMIIQNNKFSQMKDYLLKKKLEETVGLDYNLSLVKVFNKLRCDKDLFLQTLEQYKNKEDNTFLFSKKGSNFVKKFDCSTGALIFKGYQKGVKQNLVEIGTFSGPFESFTGTKKNAKKQERGICAYPTGEYYDGYWQDDLKNGEGIWYEKSGKIKYVGKWQDDIYEGKGILYMENGFFYEGSFHLGKESGLNMVKYPRGKIYMTGYWKEGKKQGVFRVFSENDDKFKDVEFDDNKITDIYKNFDVCSSVLESQINEDKNQNQTISGKHKLGQLVAYIQEESTKKYWECPSMENLLSLNYKKVRFFGEELLLELTNSSLSTGNWNSQALNRWIPQYKDPTSSVFDIYDRLIFVVNQDSQHWYIAEIDCSDWTKYKFIIYDRLRDPGYGQHIADDMIVQVLKKLCLQEIESKWGYSEELRTYYSRYMERLDASEYLIEDLSKLNHDDNDGFIVSGILQLANKQKSRIELNQDDIDEMKNILLNLSLV